LVFQGGADREKSTGAAQSPILKKLASVFDFSCFLSILSFAKRSFYSELGEYYPLLRSSRMYVCHSREKSPFEALEVTQPLLSLYLPFRFCYCSKTKYAITSISSQLRK